MAVRMCAMSAIMQDVMGFVNSLGLGNSNILGGPGGNGGGNGTGGSSGNGDGNYGYVDKEHSICNPEFAALAQGCLNLMVTLYDRTGVSEKVIESLDFVETYAREGKVSQENITGLAAAAIKPVRFRLNGMDDISEEIIENIDNANWDDVVEWVGENVEYQSASQMKKATFKESWYEKNGKYQLKCLVYEYRDKEYCVYMGDTQDTLAEQHRMQQTYIDSQIEIEERSKNNVTTDAMGGFIFFWDYVNGRVDEDGNIIAE
jgi:hypothetical protein